MKLRGLGGKAGYAGEGMDDVCGWYPDLVMPHWDGSYLTPKRGLVGRLLGISRISHY